MVDEYPQVLAGVVPVDALDSGLVRHAGHEMADQVRKTIGTLARGGEGDRLTGHSVYNLLEDEATSKRPKRDADFGNENFRSGSPYFGRERSSQSARYRHMWICSRKRQVALPREQSA